MTTPQHQQQDWDTLNQQLTQAAAYIQQLENNIKTLQHTIQQLTSDNNKHP